MIMLVDNALMRLKRALYSYIADEVIEDNIDRRHKLESAKKILTKRQRELKRLTSEHAPDIILTRIKDDIQLYKMRVQELSSSDVHSTG